MKIRIKKSKKKEEFLFIKGQINLTNLNKLTRRYLIDLFELVKHSQKKEREISRNNFILDLLAKSLVQNDEELKCRNHFRRTRIWQAIADKIKVSMVHKYRFHIYGLRNGLEDREDVILTFINIVSQVFNRQVHIEHVIGNDMATLVIYKPEFGQPIIKFVKG